MKKLLLILYLILLQDISFAQKSCYIETETTQFCLGDTVILTNECVLELDSLVWEIGVSKTNYIKINKDTLHYVVPDTTLWVNNFPVYTARVYCELFFKDKSIRVANLFTPFLNCPIKNIAFKSNKRVICEGESIDFEDQSDRVPTVWNWTFEGAVQNTSDKKNPKGIVYNKKGKYKVTLEVDNKKGKKSLEKVEYIEVLPKKYKISDTIVTLNAFLGANVSLQSCSKGDKYQWTPSDNLDCNNCEKTNLEATKDIKYTCTVKNNDYCDISCNFLIKIDSFSNVYVPTIFSPNDDGLNDQFEIFSKNILFENLEIFDRSGNLLFKTNDAVNKWDGTFRGEIVQQGTYVYIFDYINLIDKKKYSKKGTIGVVR